MTTISLLAQSLKTLIHQPKFLSNGLFHLVITIYILATYPLQLSAMWVICLIFCSITDYADQFIYPIALTPAIIIGLVQYSFNQLDDLLIGVITLASLLIIVSLNKLGLGDVLIYLTIGLNQSFEKGNYCLIVACILILLSKSLTHSSKKTAFVPYILVAWLIISKLMP